VEKKQKPNTQREKKGTTSRKKKATKTNQTKPNIDKGATTAGPLQARRKPINK
jgi:hypothetical protein